MRAHFLYLALLVGLFSVQICSGEEKINHGDLPDVYQRLSSISFMHAGEYFLTLRKRERVSFALLQSFTMFDYWYITRNKGVLSSPSVDAAIQSSYADFYYQDRIIRSMTLFSDPLQWLGGNQSIKLPVSSTYSDLTIDRYQEILPDYLKFLESRIKGRLQPSEARK